MEVNDDCESTPDGRFLRPARSEVTREPNTVWVSDKFEHFKPDGSDVKMVELPDGYPASATSIPVPNLTATVLIDTRTTDPTKGIDRGQLVIAPLAEKEPYYILEGYVVLSMVLSADGTKVYFVGAKGEELARGLVLQP